MFKRGVILLMALLLVLVSGVSMAAAQGGDDPDFTVDWCLVWNLQQRDLDLPAELAAIEGEIDELRPGDYEYTVPRVSGSVSLSDLLAGNTSGVTVRQETILVRIQDRGIDCATGDAPGAVRLWDDRMTMVIYRNANYDVAFYRVNGTAIHTTPYWMMVGPFEAGQLIDEHETIGGTLRLYYLHDDIFQMNWYGPEGGLALAIPFTYPEPCPPFHDSDHPGAPRICPGWGGR